MCIYTYKKSSYCTDKLHNRLPKKVFLDINCLHVYKNSAHVYTYMYFFF